MEAQAQKSSSRESDNAAKEKSALTQQLSRLQPELEELRAKLTSHHATLAAKENLQRQVDSLETELENEKRLRQQLEANSGDRRAHRELRAKLEQVEKSLMKERKERDVLKKMLEDARNEQEQHGQRPVALKPERAKSGKSQSTSVKRGNLEKEEEPRKSENSHSDLGLERGQAVAEKNRKRSVAPKRQANQTRQTAEISFEDITIQTPGNDWQYEKRLHKKRDDDKKLFGAKSDFSITPFLNKSKGLADDSPDRPSRSLSLSIAEDQVSIGSPAVSAGNENVFIEESPSIQAESHNGLRRRTAKPKKAALMEASDSEVNRSILRGSKTVTKPGPKKRVRLGTATDVEPENLGQENMATMSANKDRIAAVAQTDAEAKSPTVKVADADTKTRKRKILGAAANPILEGDDCIETTQTLEAPLRSGPAKRVKAPLGGGVTNAFASTSKAFSPLKRHRRGVNASFLG